MFQNIYPVFEPKRLLKKEMLENLRDFPRSLFGLQYQNYSDGILYGCDITGTETGMILLPGILCYKGVPYFLERPYPVSCKAEGKMAYVKVHFWDKTIGSGGEEYLSQIIVDEQEPDAEQELELRTEEFMQRRYEFRYNTMTTVTEYRDFAQTMWTFMITRPNLIR